MEMLTDTIRQNANGDIIVVGCNYHVTWQSHPAMRFVLSSVDGNRALLRTRRTGKSFWANVDDLVFINSSYNKEKAKKLIEKQYS